MNGDSVVTDMLCLYAVHFLTSLPTPAKAGILFSLKKDSSDNQWIPCHLFLQHSLTIKLIHNRSVVWQGGLNVILFLLFPSGI